MARTWNEITAKYKNNENPETMIIIDILTELVIIRIDLGMTQKEIAKKTGMTQSTIARIESLNNGLPSLKSIVRYANALDRDIKILTIPKN